MSRDPASLATGVVFGKALMRRFGAFAGRLAAAREREEVGSKRALQGEGQEFVGHRPYRPGEDLRQLDWELLARLDRAFVRVQRSNASEAWVVAIDTSASMGVGWPGKLQSAAEFAAASIAVGLHLGAEVTVTWFDPRGGPTSTHLRGKGDQAKLFHRLAQLRTFEAGTDGGLERHLEGPEATVPRLARRRSGASRVLLFGDFLDVSADAVLRLGGGRRRVHLGQVLSPSEWDPASGMAWVDPESRGEMQRDMAHRGMEESGGSLTPAELSRYRSRLESFVESWEDLARAHGMSYAAWSSSDPFEEFLPGLLR